VSTKRPPPRGRRRRVLNAEEEALWAHVVSQVVPLRPLSLPPLPRASAPAEPPREMLAAPAAAGFAAGSVPERKAAPARAPALPPAKPLAPLEPKTRRRLVRGAQVGLQVGARIDLHGLTQAAAHQRLRHFLVDARHAGHGLVLVITGKGAREGARGEGAFGDERGVLRRAVPHWLAEADLRPLVLGFEEAGPRHGGAGALYVRLRRRG